MQNLKAFIPQKDVEVYLGEFHSIDGAYQLFRCMTDSNIVVLAFTYLFREVSAEVLVPVADIFAALNKAYRR